MNRFKNLMIAVLAVTFSLSSMAQADQKANGALKKAIDQKAEQLGALAKQFKNVKADAGVVTVEFTRDTIELILVGGGTTYLALRDFQTAGVAGSIGGGTGPFSNALRQVEKFNPEKGAVIQGPAVRAVEKAGVKIGVQALGYLTLVSGAVWTAVEAYRFTRDGAILTFDLAKLAVLETRIQLAEHGLRQASADLAAIQDSK